MNVEKKNLDKSQIELNVELSYEEFKPYIEEGAQEVSKENKIEGFREGKAPYEVVKNKVGEMAILDKAARIAVNKTVNKAIDDNADRQPIGQPKVDITKLSPNNPMAYKVVFAVLPEVKLGDYKKKEVEPVVEELSQEEVDKAINHLQEAQVQEEAKEGEIKDGDKVVADIDMSIDNVPVEGGQSKDTSIIIGKDYLVPGFDDNLKGAKKGDELNFSVDYPEKHHQSHLAGKKVDFKVNIKEVSERKMPEMDDQFAQKFGLQTIDELKNTIKENMQQEKNQKNEQKTESKLVDEILQDAEFGEIPDILIDDETQKMLQEMEQNITSQGGKFDDYLASIEKSKEQLSEELKPEAEKRIKVALLIREIGKREEISASKEEIDEKQNELINQYKGYEKVEERVKDPNYRVYLENLITNNKVVKQLKDWNLKKSKEEDSSADSADSPQADSGQEETGNEGEDSDEKKEESEKDK